MQVGRISTKMALVKSKLPDTDYVVNPYVGCGFGCLYCYASFMGRLVNHSISDWGHYVYAKINIAKQLDDQLTKLPNQGKSVTILFSSVTDPYQGVEAKFKLTRQCLKVLVNKQFQGLVAILTKSFLVCRDIDLLQQLPHVEVGLTITTDDDALSRHFEIKAPPTSKRLKTLTKLNQAGIPTYAFVGPVLPHLLNRPSLLDKLLGRIRATGTKRVFVEHLNASPYIKKRLAQQLTKSELLPSAKSRQTDKIIHQLITKHGLTLLGGQIIRHQVSNR